MDLIHHTHEEVGVATATILPEVPDSTTSVAAGRRHAARRHPSRHLLACRRAPSPRRPAPQHPLNKLQACARHREVPAVSAGCRGPCQSPRAPTSACYPPLALWMSSSTPGRGFGPCRAACSAPNRPNKLPQVLPSGVEIFGELAFGVDCTILRCAGSSRLPGIGNCVLGLAAAQLMQN